MRRDSARSHLTGWILIACLAGCTQSTPLSAEPAPIEVGGWQIEGTENDSTWLIPPSDSVTVLSNGLAVLVPDEMSVSVGSTCAFIGATVQSPCSDAVSEPGWSRYSDPQDSSGASGRVVGLGPRQVVVEGQPVWGRSTAPVVEVHTELRFESPGIPARPAFEALDEAGSLLAAGSLCPVDLCGADLADHECAITMDRIDCREGDTTVSVLSGLLRWSELPLIIRAAAEHLDRSGLSP